MRSPATDSVVLELQDREGPAAWGRFAWSVCGAFVLLGLCVVGLASRPAPAPVCITAERCRAHLPPEVNPSPPARAAWVDQRVAEVLDSVRTSDRLPNDIDVVDHLSMREPGPAEWAFLAAEHAERRVIADTASNGLSIRLRQALDRYRAESGDTRLHFEDGTRFVAEIHAVRAAVDRQAARARLDSLADRNRTVLDLGTTSAEGLVRAASDVALAEWSARRTLEDVRLARVTADLLTERTRAEVGWLFGMVLGGLLWLGAVGAAVRFALRAVAARRPVRIEISPDGLRVDGRWIPRDAVVWVGTRAGALRVVTDEVERISRPVADERALLAALRQWDQLAAVR